MNVGLMVVSFFLFLLRFGQRIHDLDVDLDLDANMDLDSDTQSSTKTQYDANTFYKSTKNNLALF